jgi:F0F1-type ATP synthase assembly protein I
MSDAGPGPGEKADGPRPLEKPLPPLKYPKRRPAPGSEPPNLREGTGWAVVSYLIGGMVLYGGIGWLIGRWTHIAALLPIGLLLGIGLSLALIIFRFTRQL